MAGDVLEGEDPEQADMMDEMCILVDEEDMPIGSASKLDCHRGAGLRHRAFSVLIFDDQCFLYDFHDRTLASNLGWPIFCMGAM